MLIIAKFTTICIKKLSIRSYPHYQKKNYRVIYNYEIMSNEKYCTKFGNKKFLLQPRFSPVYHFQTFHLWHSASQRPS